MPSLTLRKRGGLVDAPGHHGVCRSTVMSAGRSKEPGPGSPATPSIEPDMVDAMQKVEAYTAEAVPGVPCR